MKKQTIYFLEDSDSSLTYLIHARNRMVNFEDPKNEIDIFGQKSFNRIVFDKRFTEEDVKNLIVFFKTLSNRATEKYTNEGSEYSKGILQAAQNIIDKVLEFKADFEFKKKLLESE